MIKPTPNYISVKKNGHVFNSILEKKPLKREDHKEKKTDVELLKKKNPQIFKMIKCQKKRKPKKDKNFSIISP